MDTYEAPTTRTLNLPKLAPSEQAAYAGWIRYYGLTGNSKRLSGFRYWVIRHWRKALARRSRKGCAPWDRMKDILDRYPLPPATVVHSIYAT